MIAEGSSAWDEHQRKVREKAELHFKAYGKRILILLRKL